MFRAPSLVTLRARVCVFLGALAVVAAVLVPVTGSASAAPARSTVDWTPCRDGFQCATVAVPLDYDQPDGATISLQVVRLPAGDPDHRLGALFMNPGGPGASGVDLVRAIGPLLPLELRGRFDLVGFDPRGILGSTPLRCFDTFDHAVEVLAPFAFPYTRAEEDQQRTLDARFGAACASHGGPIRDHMSTADVARDMDRLRAMMGDRKLSYLGFSYGSYLGATYANMFPNRFRALVVDGVLDPVAWATGRGSEGRTLPVTTRLRSDRGAQATLGEFFRLCDAAGTTACAFAPRSAARYASLITRARRAPLVVGTPPDTYTVSYADIVGTTLGAMYSPLFWTDFAAALADLEASVSPSAVRADFARLRHRFGYDAPAQEEYPNFIEGFPSVLCSDSVNPTTFGAWHRAAVDAERRNGYFGRLWTWPSSPCLPWPRTAGQNRYMGPWTKRTAAPVLVVGNYFDPATRYQGAVTLSDLLPNSELLTYAGWGHTAFFGGNYCIDAAVTRYLVTARTPAPGTVCQPTSNPFESYGTMAEQRAATWAETGVPMLPPGVREAVRPRRH